MPRRSGEILPPRAGIQYELRVYLVLPRGKTRSGTANQRAPPCKHGVLHIVIRGSTLEIKISIPFERFAFRLSGKGNFEVLLLTWLK